MNGKRGRSSERNKKMTVATAFLLALLLFSMRVQCSFEHYTFGSSLTSTVMHANITSLSGDEKKMSDLFRMHQSLFTAFMSAMVSIMSHYGIISVGNVSSHDISVNESK